MPRRYNLLFGLFWILCATATVIAGRGQFDVAFWGMLIIANIYIKKDLQE